MVRARLAMKEYFSRIREALLFNLWFPHFVHTHIISVPQLFIKYIEQTFLGVFYMLGTTLSNVDYEPF